MSATSPIGRSAARRLTLLALVAVSALVPSGLLQAGSTTSAPATPSSDPTTTTTTTTTTTEPVESTDPATSTEPTTTTTTAPLPTSTVTSTTAVTTTTAPTTTVTTTVTTTTVPSATVTTTSVPAGPAAAPAAIAAAVPEPTCAVSMTVRLGTRGDPARCVETRLVQLGYWLAGPDANFDSTAVNALKAFQTKVGRTANGVADRATLEALEIWTAPRPLPAPTCRTSVTVKVGVLGEPADCVESRLRQLGYWLVGPDSNFDSTAANALRAFQSRYGLLNDGIAGKTTLQILGIWVEPRPMPPAPCRTPWAVYPGNKGFPVRCLETRLSQLGYWMVGPDDTFDDSGVVALRRFQSRQGLASTGVADYATLTRLGIYTPLVQPAASCKTHFAVRPGSTGSGARCVEQRLVQLGFSFGTPDGFFDSAAVSALRSFQYRNGLMADGIAGSRTLLRLGIYDPNPPPATALPDDSGTGRRIVYSRAQQRIWAVDANGVVVKTHRVSGRLYEPYRGTYYVYSRSLYTNSINDPSVRWRYMVRFAYGPGGGRIGFHEIPNRYGVPLQSYEQLGLPLSGGCVRQTTADALWVWNWAYIGTKVVVL